MTITMTNTATDAVKTFMAMSDDIDKDSFLRIGILGGGCSGVQYSLQFDSVYNDEVDTKYDCNGITLATERKFDPHFDGTEIDYFDSVHGSGYTINNPNFQAVQGCPGCGCH
ncbi:MAG: iron-sulfur cluster assembly accessory protein [Planctomycetaceae bacterium]|nr:iron-sulfur cluster assembly accessory protein [Planctomycetaceae bacterium]